MHDCLPCRVLSLAAAALFSTAVQADILIFNSSTPADNEMRRIEWLVVAGIDEAANLVDFESGFSDEQNVSGISGLFPDGLIISDTSGDGEAIIRSGSGTIGGSNPVGTFSLTHNERPFLELDFVAWPVDYIAFQDIDQAGTSGVVTFEDGTSVNISLETTGTGGDTAEFFGIFRNDMPPIVRLELNASGDGRWGIDTLEYGSDLIFHDSFEN